jgi:hypothetical protein
MYPFELTKRKQKGTMPWLSFAQPVPGSRNFIFRMRLFGKFRIHIDLIQIENIH